jgi:hypothetical protein
MSVTNQSTWRDILAEFNLKVLCLCGTGSVVDISDWLLAGRSGDRILVGVRFSAPVQTGPGFHPASCTMGTGSFPGVKSGRCVTLTSHPLLVPLSRKGRAIPLPPYGPYGPHRATVPVQGCTLLRLCTFEFWLHDARTDLIYSFAVLSQLHISVVIQVTFPCINQWVNAVTRVSFLHLTYPSSSYRLHDPQHKYEEYTRYYIFYYIFFKAKK